MATATKKRTRKGAAKRSAKGASKRENQTPRSTSAHFTPELFRFLRQLKRNNNREWFEKNKPQYIEHVRDPMLHFIEDFAPRLWTITPHLVADPKPVGGSMFRIYRDVRFAKDKRPYKEAATAQFRHAMGKDVHAPCFYLHLGSDGVYAASGIWHPDADSLRKIRGAIVARPAAWKKALAAPAFRRAHRLSGDSLQRPPKGIDPDHPLLEDLKRKDFVSVVELDEQAACSPRFLTQYTNTCRASTSFMKFLSEAVGLPF